MTPRHKRSQGVVLALVLIIALLLSAAMLAFVRRSVIDGMIIKNRNYAASCAALARGGIQIAMAVVMQDRYAKAMGALKTNERPGSTLQDTWARVGHNSLTTSYGARLTVTIEDAGMRLNLNALVPVGKEGAESEPSEEAEEFLKDFIEMLIDRMEVQDRKQAYDARELARNLLDYMDTNKESIGGGNEDDYYLRQDPPHVAPNRPLLSVRDVGMVEGFDQNLVEAMLPYVTVHPYVSSSGININTADPHVLTLVYHGSSGDMRLADEDTVRDILKLRGEGRLVCDQTESAPKRCVSPSEVGIVGGSVYPEISLPTESTVYIVKSMATIQEVSRSVEAVIDTSNKEEPRLLSWRTH